MLTLEVKDKQLSTSEDFSVTIEDRNPATDFEEIPGSKGVGIQLPINAANRTILRNPDRYEKMGTTDDRRFTGAALRHHGQVIQKGTLVIDDTKNGYSGWLRDVVGNLAERVTGKLINQSTLGGERTFANKTNYNPLTDDYACPKLFNRHFWRDRGKRSDRQVTTTDLEGNESQDKEDDNELSWQFLENEQFLVNYPTATGVKADGVNTAPVVSPMLFLWKLVELILSDNKIFVKENFLKENVSLQKLILYNNFNILKQVLVTEPKIFYYMRYEEYMRLTAEEKTVTKVTYIADKFQLADLIPKLSLGELILSTQNLLNVVFSFNDLDECRIVDRQRLLTGPAYDVDEYMFGEWELHERKSVTVKLEMEHEENDYAFSDNWQDLSDMRHNIKESVQQRADLDLLSPEMDEIRKVTSENNYYQWHWHVLTTGDSLESQAQEDILGWEMITIGFQPYFYNDEDKEVEEIKTKFSTLRQSRNGYPLTMQKGNAEMFRTQHESFTPRLLFYGGDEAASYRTNNLALDWDGDDGLANQRWNFWLPFWANRLPATGYFKFPASVFYYIKNNKALLPLKTRHGSFIIDEIDAVANREDMIECKLSVFKRESVMEYEEGVVPGEPEPPTPPVFEPLWVGVTDTGRPYLVNVAGEVKIPPSWGTLSPAAYASRNCIDWDPVSRQLYVGGWNGMLYVTDLSDVDNMSMKGIRTYSGGHISSVRYVNGKILIGRDDSREVHQQPHHASLADYRDFEATSAGNLQWPRTLGFTYYGGYYYACTYEGEIWRSNNLSSWSEITDRRAHWWTMLATTNRLLVFGKEDGDSYRRQFWAPKSNPTNWDEFSVGGLTKGYYVEDAVPMGTDQAIMITNKEYLGSAKLLSSNNATTEFTPPLAKHCGGACATGAMPFIAIKEGSGATKIAGWSQLQNKWVYHNVPQFYTKLFMY
ncbi:hypothetical protein [Sunxiuqinia sp. sy24]|uniref:hypothetical protein n=1 Tax=Sunxiuqinia sp. sy24 TaxID=3461495 RepID=UPI00404545ED